MSTMIKIGERSLNITHINALCAGPDALYAAEYPMLVIDPQEGGANMIVLRSLYSSRELVIASEAFIPDQYLPMFMRHAVPIDSIAGKNLQRLDASRC